MSFNRELIIKRYDEACTRKSDINELLPYLRGVAEAAECKHITEFGVRQPTSTWALLAAEPDRLISYDIARDRGVDEVEMFAPQGVYQFIEGNVLDVEIEPTEMLFIDTFHTMEQLALELKLHADKVSKIMAFHDTHTYWEKGEPPYDGIKQQMWESGRGLKYALQPWLQRHPEWRVDFRTDKNNGLTIIQRYK